MQYLYHTPVCATLIPLAVCKFVIWYNGVSMLKTIYIGYRHARNFIINYGLSALAETEWMRLNVPCVLRTFWMLRVGEQVVQILGNHYGEETFNYYVMIRTLLVNGCETLTAVLGMTSIISFICHYIGYFFQWILLTTQCYTISNQSYSENTTVIRPEVRLHNAHYFFFYPCIINFVRSSK